MTEPERIEIPVPGMRFGALAWGKPGRPLALMVHGYPDSAWTWRHLGPKLAAQGWYAVAPFTRGYAPTDLAPNDRYLIADQARDLLALHTALGAGPDAALIGHDWGGTALWKLTELQPDRFARYVVLAAPVPGVLLMPFRSPRTIRVAARQARMSWYIAFNQLPGAVRVQPRINARLRRKWSPGYRNTEDLTELHNALPDRARPRAAVKYYRDNLREGLRTTLRLRGAAPALCLHGERDGCIQAELLGRFAGAWPAGCQREIVPGVGHFLHLEDPPRVNALIADWISAPSS